MKAFFREHKLQLLCFTLCGLVGGFFTGVYSVETLAPNIKDTILQQVGSLEVLYVITALQAAGYGLVLGAIGILLAKKTGLWKPMTFQKHPAQVTVIASVICGVCFIVFDLLFAKASPFVAGTYTAKPTVSYCIAAVLYGGVIEEILMRLFLMSLLTLVLWKLLARKTDIAPVWCAVTANALTALLFAAGHLPATAAATQLTPIILLRCFLLNGSFGFVFGELYRRYGILHAMTCHAGTHIVSKLIWILFV